MAPVIRGALIVLNELSGTYEQFVVVEKWLANRTRILIN